MHLKIKTIGTLLAVLVIASTASAGILATDTHAIGAFQGNATMFLATRINAKVDFAVYAPNPGNSNFNLTFGAGADPSGGTHFVYAYQVFNQSSGSNKIRSLSVGLDGDEFNEGVVPQYIGFVGSGVAPNSWYFVPGDGSVPPTSARWFFPATAYLPVGQSSRILFYTCPAGPEWDNATVSIGAYAATAAVPEATPIPEPLTLSLLAVSVLGLCARRRRAI